MQATNFRRGLILAGCVLVMSGCSMFGLGKSRPDPAAVLTGAQQVPANASKASATQTLSVNARHQVAGAVSLKGMKASSANIHTGAAGIKGPAIIMLEKTSDTIWTVPRGAMLSQAQYVAWKAGNLYVNVASESFPEGEIRAQLRAAD